MRYCLVEWLQELDEIIHVNRTVIASESSFIKYYPLFCFFLSNTSPTYYVPFIAFSF